MLSSVKVGDDSRRHGRVAGFPDADERARHKHLPETACQSGSGRGKAPQRDAGGDQVLPGEQVAQASEERRSNGIGNHESRECPAQFGIGEVQFPFDRFKDRGQYVTVDVVQEVDKGQYDEGYAGVAPVHAKFFRSASEVGGQQPRAFIFQRPPV